MNLYKIEIFDTCAICKGEHYCVASGPGDAINKLFNAIKECTDMKDIIINKVELIKSDIIV